MKIKNLKIGKRIGSLAMAIVLMNVPGFAKGEGDGIVDTNSIVIEQGMSTRDLDEDTLYFDGTNLAYRVNEQLKKMNSNSYSDFTISVYINQSDDRNFMNSGFYIDYNVRYDVENNCFLKAFGYDINGNTVTLDMDKFLSGVISLEDLTGASLNDYVNAGVLREGSPYYININVNSTNGTNMVLEGMHVFTPYFYYYQDDVVSQERRANDYTIDFDPYTGSFNLIGNNMFNDLFFVYVNGENISLGDPNVCESVCWDEPFEMELKTNLHERDFLVSHFEDGYSERLGSYMDYYFGYYDNNGEFHEGKVKEGDNFYITSCSNEWFTKEQVFDLAKYQESLRSIHTVGQIDFVGDCTKIKYNAHANATSVKMRGKFTMYSFDFEEPTYIELIPGESEVDISDCFDTVFKLESGYYYLSNQVIIIEETPEGTYVHKSNVITQEVEKWNDQYKGITLSK